MIAGSASGSCGPAADRAICGKRKPSRCGRTHTASTKPPLKVEYSLAPLGQTLVPLISAMRDWGAVHEDTVLANRRAVRERCESVAYG